MRTRPYLAFVDTGVGSRVLKWVRDEPGYRVAVERAPMPDELTLDNINVARCRHVADWRLK